ncbi:glycoside hydrolase family 2 protein [Paenibacillus sp. MBLB2552]|uniref:Beta-mannosidase B n=1 Tax=Paenibacillus mellifer TaxID=2937794 RepID=A0A9X1Y1C8_9BACL|nr:glycoside hydrolase family 2 protein [Paenibacillus mellifer]MCK8489585.1 glycoside hydrolase family 2 protein [Paenibacillus mellifer]
MILSGPWKLQHVEVGEKPPLELAAPGLDDRFWIEAVVPGDVHSALLERGIIEPPYFGHNDAKCRWIERKEWWYRTTFELDDVPGEEERIELTFEGLDTFAAVYVNGHEIGLASNMFRCYMFDITRIVREGRNTLAVRFDPLYLHHRDKEQFEWSSYTKERPWIRKAAMNFGWDWGPRIVTTGIWGPVRLERRKLSKLTGVYAATLSASVEEAVIRVNVEAEAYRAGTAAVAVARLLAADGVEVASATLPVLNGDAGSLGGQAARRQAFPSAIRTKGAASAELRIALPRRWWTHDLGDPYLYTLEVTLLVGGEEVDRYEQSFGIRTLELSRQNPDGSPSFAFILNGIKVYAKGANWIPADHLIGSIPDSTYHGLVELAVEGQMNMLRVWAGGIYEKEIFYEECDRRGVLVWQDFAFANALFPDFNRDFMDNVQQEIIDNVKRLRNRASLALWCGNNEIDWLVDMKSAAGDITGAFFGETIYHELIPGLLAELDPHRPYWPSSPYGAQDGYDVNDPNQGDRHNWQVWHGSVYPRMQGEKPRLDYSIEGVTFKNYKQDLALLSSEFGMHASANRYTLEKNIPEGKFTWGSAEMAYRNKDTNHRKGILLMEGFTGIPQDVEEYMNFSMLTQAEGLKYGIEHFRRHRHRNSGALVWQLNDSWPGTSWSMIDYELLPKASYYYGKTFFHPVLLSLEHESGEPLRVWVVNDTLEELEGTVTLTVHPLVQGGDLAGGSGAGAGAGRRTTFAVKVPPQTALSLGSLEEAEALAGLAPEEVVVELSATGFAAPANRYYLRDSKEIRLPVAELDVRVDEAAQTVTVTASGRGVARLVKLELPLGGVRFSDNYFDLLPGESRTVRLRHPGGLALPWAELRVGALNAGTLA